MESMLSTQVKVKIMIYDILLYKEGISSNNSIILSVRTRFATQPKRFGQWPNEPKTMNLLESGPDIERSMSEDYADHNRLVGIEMDKTNSLNKKSSPQSNLKNVCSFIFLLDLYKNYSSWLHSDISLVFLIIPLVMEFFPFIFHSLLSSQPSTCRLDC